MKALEQFLDDFNCAHYPEFERADGTSVTRIIPGWCADCQRDVVAPLSKILNTANAIAQRSFQGVNPQVGEVFILPFGFFGGVEEPTEDSA